jgi:hypothetical protein
MKAEKQALREFLSAHLGEAELREASGLIAKFVAAAVNGDRARRTTARADLNEALSGLSALTAELHRRRPSGAPVEGEPASKLGVMDSAGRMTRVI